jgi:general secretion pathway protein G
MLALFSKLLPLAVAAGLGVNYAPEIKAFYDELTAVTQQVVTAGDMRQITQMLDYTFIRKGRYPSAQGFPSWMERSFKENGIKSNRMDFWGNPWIYEAGPKRRRFALLSTGPDGVPGTEDDLKMTGP